MAGAGDRPAAARQRERVAKVLARRGLCSRREAEQLVRAGLVRVAGTPVTDPATRIPPTAAVELLPEAWEALRRKRTVLLNKPRGVDSIAADPATGAAALVRADRAWRTEADAAREIAAAARRLAVAGRLDRDSRGLLVLTEDGRVARALVGGRGVPKEYEVRVEPQVSEGQIRKLRSMRALDGKPLRPMEVGRLGPGRLRFVLVEGRKHQIRRACRRVGLRVLDLVRRSVGPIRLGDLPEGRWREASRAEIEALLALAGEPPPSGRRG